MSSNPINVLDTLQRTVSITIRGSVTAQSIDKLFSNHTIFIEDRYLLQCFKIMLIDQSYDLLPVD
ncbi:MULTISPECIES: hypothetical protein [Enterobacter cloacae complex]|uniref:hypothetical protein n=1 Tax=Enterobacter cloacae complex TaxID=354276 RepID=UPI002075C7FF|nr:hypothetical protein [Enterobacter cloacae]MCM8142473.1 hypothetical protein [Enterobacter cloacae]